MLSVQAQITTEQLMDAIKQLPVKERRKLRKQLDKLPETTTNGKPHRNGHQGKTQPKIEADLLDRIRVNSSLPVKAHRRLNLLRRKLEDETISESELKESQELWSRVEWMATERLEALIELAKLRGTDYKTLMHELGLDKKRNVF